MYLSRLFYIAFYPHFNIKEELTIKKNLAFSLSYAGHFLGLILVVGGAIIGRYEQMLYDDLHIILFGVLGVLLLHLSEIITDKIAVWNVNLNSEIEQKNISAGITKMSLSIASGICIMGALIGEKDNFSLAILFWAVSLCILIFTTKIYFKMMPYKMDEEILKKNIPVSIVYLGVASSISILIFYGDSSTFYSVKGALVNLGMYTGIGLICLPVIRYITDKIILPGQKLTKHILSGDASSLGFAIIEATIYISVALLLVWSY